jgi:uncharacterized protein YjeT (DUF2065 family)
VVLYVMLCGRRPFDDAEGAPVQVVLNAVPPRPSERSAATPGIDELVRHCLTALPTARIQSMTEVIERIDVELGELVERGAAIVVGADRPFGAPVDAGTQHTQRMAQEREALMRLDFHATESSTMERAAHAVAPQAPAPAAGVDPAPDAAALPPMRAAAQMPAMQPPAQTSPAHAPIPTVIAAGEAPATLARQAPATLAAHPRTQRRWAGTVAIAAGLVVAVVVALVVATRGGTELAPAAPRVVEPTTPRTPQVQAASVPEPSPKAPIAPPIDAALPATAAAPPTDDAVTPASASEEAEARPGSRKTNKKRGKSDPKDSPEPESPESTRYERAVY